jgi:D-beta-D-heptose 7-phosphate kinase / D-beta-D-heptose 1-phosphate adenosyltransferase
MTKDEARQLLQDGYFKFIRSDQLAARSRVMQREGTIVATSGCFDILHAGHVRFFEAAYRLGLFLIVCLNSDESVRRLKGPGRPIVALQDRLEVLHALWMVSHIAVFDEESPEDILEQLRPNVWVKGGDYQHKDLPERPIVEKYGGVVQILPYDPGHSTTALWVRLQGLEEEKRG